MRAHQPHKFIRAECSLLAKHAYIPICCDFLKKTIHNWSDRILSIKSANLSKALHILMINMVKSWDIFIRHNQEWSKPPLHGKTREIFNSSVCRSGLGSINENPAQRAQRDGSPHLGPSQVQINRPAGNHDAPKHMKPHKRNPKEYILIVQARGEQH